MVENWYHVYPDFKEAERSDYAIVLGWKWMCDIRKRFPYHYMFLNMTFNHQETELWCLENFERDFCLFDFRKVIYCKNEFDLMAFKLMFA